MVGKVTKEENWENNYRKKQVNTKIAKQKSKFICLT
jgi:hypothetical protein